MARALHHLLHRSLGRPSLHTNAIRSDNQPGPMIAVIGLHKDRLESPLAEDLDGRIEFREGRRHVGIQREVDEERATLARQPVVP